MIEKQNAADPDRETHRLTMENREQLTATGVKAVLSYDETGACLETACGMLNIGGAGLTVSELSVQTGEVRISGEIEFVQYSRAKERSAPFWKRLTR